MKTTSNPLFTHPLVLGSIALVVVVAIGSGIYYHIETAVPTVNVSAADATSTAQSLTAIGTVEPAQNPISPSKAGGLWQALR